jgi:hypothetical protein
VSKLLDKLRSATRSRDAIVSIGKPLDNGLLSQALRRAQAERAALRAANEQLETEPPESQPVANLEQERAEQQVESALQAAIVEDHEAESAALARAEADRRVRETLQARAEADRKAEDAALRRAEAERRALEEASLREEAEHLAAEAAEARRIAEERLFVEPSAQPPRQPAIEPRVAAPRATAPDARDRRTRAMIIALVVMALVAAAAAWNHAAPPARPDALKLDYGLDVTRMDASKQSSPPDRARSR